MGIFGADIDVALGRADGDAGDRHALDQHEGIAFHDHAVGEGAGIALVGVADDVFLLRPACRRRCFHLMPVGKPAPPRPRRPECVTSSTIAAGPSCERLGQALVAAMRLCSRRASSGSMMPQRAKVSRVCCLRNGISSARPRRERVRAAVQHAGIEQAVDIGRRHRPIGDAALGPSRPRPSAPARTGRASRCARSRRRARASRSLAQSAAPPHRRRRTARRHRAETKTRASSPAPLSAERSSFASSSMPTTCSPSSIAAGEHGTSPRQ